MQFVSLSFTNYKYDCVHCDQYFRVCVCVWERERGREWVCPLYGFFYDLKKANYLKQAIKWLLSRWSRWKCPFGSQITETKRQASCGEKEKATFLAIWIATDNKRQLCLSNLWSLISGGREGERHADRGGGCFRWSVLEVVWWGEEERKQMVKCPLDGHY